MKTVEIDIDNTPSPKALADEFRAQNLQKGDKLLLISSKIDDTQLLKLAVIIVVLVAINKIFQERMEYSEELLQNIFNSKSVSEVEEGIKNVYDIWVVMEVKEDQENDSWRQFSQSQLIKAYSDMEPEYTESMVKEPNPDYRK